MDADVNVNKLKNKDLLNLYNKVKDFIKFLDSEIETSEIETEEKSK